MRFTEKEWMNDYDKVISDNVVNNMTLEEMWERILEYIANHTTTENNFNYISKKNLNQPPTVENNSENNIEIEFERVL
jgi:hypothetical protein